MASIHSTDPPPSDEDRGPYLMVLDGGKAARSLCIGAQPIKIGRSEHCELTLRGASVSAEHARIDLDADRARLTDLKSASGTYVNGERVIGTHPLRNGSVMQVGGERIRYEWRTRAEIEAAEALDEDLATASAFVRSLLPKPVTEGPIRADWEFAPSAKLGGDVFGYRKIDADTVFGYMADVSGQGVTAALHATTLQSVMRWKTLPDVDFRHPGQVLSALNRLFRMERHGNLSFTIWYGVFHRPSRTLTYGSAGHHPAFLVSPDRSAAQPLQVRNPMIGASPSVDFDTETVSVPPGSNLYLFSDGVFETVDRHGQPCSLDEFLPALTRPIVPGVSEARRLYNIVQEKAPPEQPLSDCALMTVVFE